MKNTTLAFAFTLICFFHVQAQTPPAAPVPKAPAPAAPPAAAPTSAPAPPPTPGPVAAPAPAPVAPPAVTPQVPSPGPVPALTPPLNPAAVGSSDQQGRPKGMPEEAKANRANKFRNTLSNPDLRKLTTVKWPDAELKDEKYLKHLQGLKDEALLKEIGVYCDKYAQQYDEQASATLKIKKGTINFHSFCEILKVGAADVRDNMDENAREIVSEMITARFDSMLLAYVNNPIGGRENGPAKAGVVAVGETSSESAGGGLFGMLGLPAPLGELITQVLVLISLSLNGFLLFKVLKG